ncbi:heavy metal translocating P-type ATPase [Zobellella maritima]|uniref:heavy metal translocating P-type ATPase n=1 Tax=Zobellella maritima TaxID=2059725 RepID=UPI001300A783|nr:heavy metal translocating P-type ATPase [Zobellella maritima]
MGSCCHHSSPKHKAAGQQHTAGCAPRTEPDLVDAPQADIPSATTASSDSPPDEDSDTVPGLHHWQIQGMDCPSCAAQIETALRRLPGVQSAEVRFATERLEVHWQAPTTRADIEKTIQIAGFDFAASAVVTATEPESRLADRLKGYWDIALLLGLMAIATLVGTQHDGAGGLLFSLATLWGLWPVATRAWRSARSGSPFSIETLMTVAAVGALVLGETAEAAMVLLLFMVGEKLERLAAERARRGVRSLMALVPDTASRVTATGIEQVAAHRLKPGDTIEIHPGARLPVDGTLLSPLAAFDESALTGESMPVDKQQGDRLTAGSLVVDMAVRLRVDSQPGHNAIDRILHLIEQAEANRAPIARFIDNFSRWYTPAMMLAALLVMLVPPLAFAAAWETWVYRGLALLLIGCPCALVISTPAAVTSALAAATRMGVLIKGGAALEQMGKVRTMAFDKTGTLTTGRPELVKLLVSAPFEREQVLQLSANLEAGSHHPLAKALVRAAAREGIVPQHMSHRRTLPGAGIEGEWQGQQLLLCNPAHLPAQSLSELQQARVSALQLEACTLVVLTLDQQVAALFAFRDSLRADAQAGITALQQLDIRCLMLTGDNPTVAARMAGSLGIDFQAGLKPRDKQNTVARLNGQLPLAMVGDGINDAPALRQASVGIAMGQGTDVALDTADAALTHSRLTALADAVRLSRAAHANIRQNIGMALGLKAIFLVTSLTGITGLWLAVLADTGATALVTLNALRLLGHKSRF